MNERGKGDPPPPYEYFEERRRYPRVSLGRAGVVTAGGEERTCLIYDISPDGLQIRCDRETMALIRPSGRAIKRDTGPVVTVSALLPVAGDERLLTVNVRLYYFVLLTTRATMDVAFGARFVNPDAAARAVIDGFIAEAMQPAEMAPRQGK